MYNDITTKFYEKDNLEIRKENGIYITSYNIIEKCFDGEKLDGLNILEPSFGSGQFIDSAIKLLGKKKSANIIGVELLKELYDEVKKKYSSNKNIKLLNQDFLTWKTEDKFDLIVGNPPYFEKSLNNEEKKTFKEIILGRVNIYSLFIYKCIQLLEPDGRLIFVIPTSLLSSKYFEKLRFYINKTCNIEDITLLGSKDFEDALQSTMIFKVSKLEEKTKSNDKFVIKFSNTIIFSNEWKNINKIIEGKKFISDYGCDVKTGNIVWNQHKDKLADKKKNKDYIPLIYPRNLVNNQIVFKEDKKKKQYINIDKDPISAPFIVINRIIGIKEISLKPVLVEASIDKYFFENHINVITGKLEDLKKIHQSLEKPETVNFIKNIIGNTQLSKNELLYMVPVI
jgi:adenine-specific DNA-methyltransferase